MRIWVLKHLTISYVCIYLSNSLNKMVSFLFYKREKLRKRVLPHPSSSSHVEIQSHSPSHLWELRIHLPLSHWKWSTLHGLPKNISNVWNCSTPPFNIVTVYQMYAAWGKLKITTLLEITPNNWWVKCELRATRKQLMQTGISLSKLAKRENKTICLWFVNV